MAGPWPGFTCIDSNTLFTRGVPTEDITVGDNLKVKVRVYEYDYMSSRRI